MRLVQEACVEAVHAEELTHIQLSAVNPVGIPVSQS
jgi:hypothetical protein